MNESWSTALSVQQRHYSLMVTDITQFSLPDNKSCEVLVISDTCFEE